MFLTVLLLALSRILPIPLGLPVVRKYSLRNPSKRTITKYASISWLIKKKILPNIHSLNFNSSWLHTTTELMQGTCSLPADTRVLRLAVRIIQYLCSQADFRTTPHSSVQMGYLSQYTAGTSYWVCQVCTNSVPI